jgi:chromosome segregation ATPase
MLAEIDTATLFAKALPQVALISGVSAALGWILHSLFRKPAPKKAVAITSDPAAKDRSKNLEATLVKTKSAHKSLKVELDALKTASVPTAVHAQILSDLKISRKSIDSETKRSATLEADLKKAQDAIKSLNNRGNEADKAQKDRSFALENELSKTRQQLALLEARPDNAVELHAEIERLRESVAVSSRYAGEVRKREAAAVEALEKAQNKMSFAGNSAATVATAKPAIVGDSERVAAAKAEVLRLIEQNKQSVVEASTEAMLASHSEGAASSLLEA